MSRYKEDLHYQTRFELSAAETGAKPAHQMVREELWRWLLQKERRRGARPWPKIWNDPMPRPPFWRARS